MQVFLDPFSTSMAIISGLIFGFLLRKAAVCRFDTIVNQLLLKDFTVMKVILTAIVTGSIGLYTLRYLGIIPSLMLSKTPIMMTAIGGVIFGLGMSLAGYCPGTGIAAIADGSRDMIYGMIGMITGALLFNEISPWVAPYLKTKDVYYQKTLSYAFATTDLTVILALIIFWLLFVLGIGRYEKKKKLFSSST